MIGGAYRWLKWVDQSSDAPKLNTLSLRVTDSELRELKDYADSHGMTITQLLHTGVDLLLKTPDAEVQNLFP